MDRREWLKKLGGGGAGVFWFAAPAIIGCQKKSESVVQTAGPPAANAKIAFIKTSSRAEGVRRAFDLLKLDDKFKNKSLYVKPNFNSADETPGSTHAQVLEALLARLREMNAGGVLTVGDRSGMGDTRAVMEAKDAFKMARDFKARAEVFDELKQEDWQFFNFQNSLWKRGFALPKSVLAADAIVQTCCLKTHRFGGHFTLSLKNSVGLAAKRVPGDGYNFMSELHSSPDQRRMIAEINAAYKPALVVLDGVEAFTDGGPDKGTRVNSEVILAGEDRVAIDAVGVALLRSFGTTPEVQKGKIFEQEQIAQAVKLGLGVAGPAQIEFLTDDGPSAEYARKIQKLLV